MKANQQNQIEAYLSGEMSADQLAGFESELSVNPELRQELNFQSEVIKGIGEYRKIQLIARLDSLKVPSALGSLIQQLSTLQFIGGAVVIAIVGTGAWFAIQDDRSGLESTPDTNQVVVDAPDQEVIEWNLPEVIWQETTSTVTIDLTQLSNEDEKKNIRESKKSFNPVVAVPSVDDVEAEKVFVPEQAVEPSEITMASTDKSQPIDVEIIELGTLKIKYRYYDGKLYLYGNFRQEPYEILEINSATGRQIYLYHHRTFYQINPTDKIVNLQAVSNTKLIQELNILRKAK